jgi:hypothetical protein
MTLTNLSPEPAVKRMLPVLVALVLGAAGGYSVASRTPPPDRDKPTHVVVTYPVEGEERPRSAHLAVLFDGEDAAGRPFWGVSFFRGEKVTANFRCVAVPHDGIYRPGE